MIRVLLAEDETLVRSGIRTLLERHADIEVAAEAVDGEEALRLGAGLDVALLDVRMPRRSGVEVAQAMQEWPRPPACLLLTTFDDREVLLAGVRAGARGYLRKDVTVRTLARAIRVLAAGGTFFQPSLTEKLLRGALRPRGSLPLRCSWSPSRRARPRSCGSSRAATATARSPTRWLPRSPR